MADLITAIGLMLVFEGTLYALFPHAMKRAIIAMLRTPETPMRMVGLGCACLGFLFVWFIRHS